MNYQDYFSKKICVVTGAASGIGFAVSEALLKAGATVIMADRTHKKSVRIVRKARYTWRARSFHDS